MRVLQEESNNEELPSLQGTVLWPGHRFGDSHQSNVQNQNLNSFDGIKYFFLAEPKAQTRAYFYSALLRRRIGRRSASGSSFNSYRFFEYQGVNVLIIRKSIIVY